MEASQFKQILEIVQSVTVIVVGITGILGIKAWRKEFVGKRRLELAEEILALFYEARDAIASIRSSLGYVGEGQSRKQLPGERPEFKEALDDAYKTIERWHNYVELFSKLQAKRYTAMARFGKNGAMPFETFKEVRVELFVAVKMLMQVIPNQVHVERTEENWQSYRKTIERYEDILTDCGTEDPIALKMNEAVRLAEEICKEALK